MERRPPGARLAGLRLAVNSQTPLVRFRDAYAAQATERLLSLDELREPDDFKFTTGGVTRMLLPLLQAWRKAGTVEAPEWVAVAAGERAPQVDLDGLRLSFVGLSDVEKKGYALVKEKMWALLNSNPSTPVPRGEGGVPEEAWEMFERYQQRSASALQQAADRMGGLDLLYVHDFQQLGVARAWSGPDVAKVFHLHTPFPSVLPSRWADHFVDELRRYDAIIVSTRRYAENLRNAGLDTPVHVVRPFIDPSGYPQPSADEVAAFRARFHVRDHEKVVLSVGRMDPMKAQDRLIRAMPKLIERVPDARLVLVGNGSFSSSKKGGLGLSKGEQWRAALEALAADLGVAGRVTFTGHIGDDTIPAAFAACDAFCLPSTREGFGLAAIEAWRYQKPVVVSDRTGVAELVEDGVNGHALDCGDAGSLAHTLARLLAQPDRAQRMGEAGLAASDEATLPVGRAALERIFEGVLLARGRVKRVAA